MQAKEFRNVRISGLACAVPNHKARTDDYKGQFDDSTINRFKEATGIEERYLSDGTQTASDLCYVAAEQLLAKKNFSGEDLDAIIFITQTPDYTRPSTAFVLHKRLKAKKDCVAFDINLGCSAFVNGVYIIAGMIESGAFERALLLIGDAGMLTESPKEDISFNLMFGDAGAAILIEKGPGVIRGAIRADGEGYKTLITPIPGFRFPGVKQSDDPHLQKHMDGDDVFLFTITKVPKLFKEFYNSFGTSAEDYDYFILHQANKMILEQIAKKLKISMEKVPISLDRYGNTDGPSIPIGIVDLCERVHDKEKLTLIASGYGIGLSWGVASFEINCEDVLPMIFTNDYFAEGRIIGADGND